MGSAVIVDQTFTAPVCSMPFSQVSCPGSPACGIVWKVQTSAPVLTSNARTSPGGASGRSTSAIDEPMTIRSPITAPGDVTLYSQLSCTGASPASRSTAPSAPKSLHGVPVTASSAISRASSVARNTRAAHAPFVAGSAQYETPRLMYIFAYARSRSSCGSKVHSSRPVSGSSAITRFAGVVTNSRPSTTIGVDSADVPPLTFTGKLPSQKSWCS